MISDALNVAHVEAAARRLALQLRPGDVVALWGDLAAGKTTFARALIRTLTRPDEDVPSPTFPIRHDYAGERLTIAHFDLYRLSSIAEAESAGLFEAMDDAAVLIEWPERLGGALPTDRLDIRLDDAGPGLRSMAMEGHGAWPTRLERMRGLEAIIAMAGWSDAELSHVAGDASSRRYFRLQLGDDSRIAVDWPPAPDGPPLREGKPYSALVHLAVEAQPFLVMANVLRSAGIAAPQVYAANVSTGHLVIDDLGDVPFAVAPASAATRYEAAIDVLQARPALSAFAGEPWQPPAFDAQAIAVETSLLPDWALPAPLIFGSRDEFDAAWAEQAAWLATQPTGLTLRDYHSPNLLWRGSERGLARVGVIDFQDAVAAHPAYDLASLLQDARIDVPGDVQQAGLAYYLAQEEGDPADFLRAYAVLGAQRATKILGIFARLAKRDGKPAYLAHVPRVRRYLMQNLTHPALTRLAAWYAAHLPPA